MNRFLTDEPLAVRKNNWNGKTKQARPCGDDLSIIYFGSLVVSGHGARGGEKNLRIFIYFKNF
jgi:hypothetical protein